MTSQAAVVAPTTDKCLYIGHFLLFLDDTILIVVQDIP